MCPLGGRLLDGQGGLFSRARLVIHCLLIETDAHGLVLVDTGLGTADLADPKGRLGAQFLLSAAPRLDRAGTALAYVERQGFTAADVRHVVITHLDLDHAGGLSDFPHASVHVMAAEHDAALARSTSLEKGRYRPVQLAHGPRFELHTAHGESWRDFSCVRALPGLPPELLLLPLPGHTRGHACVAIERGTHAIVHAGDAYFHHATVRTGNMPKVLGFYEGLIAIDRKKVADNHRALRALEAGGNVTLFCAHDATELDALAG